MSPICLQAGVCLPRTIWRHKRARNGTHRRTNQGLETKGIAVSGERWPGAFARRIAERQNVMALSLSAECLVRKGDSWPIPGPDPEGCADEARRSGRTSRRWEVTCASNKTGESRECQQSNRPGVWRALFPRASDEELEKPIPYPALSGQ